MKRPPAKPSKLLKQLTGAPAEALSIGFDHKPGVVVMIFPKPVDRLGFTPAEAFEVAKQLAQHAQEAAKSDRKIITLN
jgi:hypothetical protein